MPPDTIDYQAYEFAASALAAEIAKRIAGQADVVVVACITEALCHFADVACRAEKRRECVLLMRVLNAYENVKAADENEWPDAVDQYRRLNDAMEGLRSLVGSRPKPTKE